MVIIWNRLSIMKIPWQNQLDFEKLFMQLKHKHSVFHRKIVLFFLPINFEGLISNRYPLFLNLENHCSYAQQGVMVRILKETFKGNIEFLAYRYWSWSFVIDRLLSKPLFDDLERLPSPEELKYKILVRVRIFIWYSTWFILNNRVVVIQKEKFQLILNQIEVMMKQNRIQR
jgi:hypothetical protein